MPFIKISGLTTATAVSATNQFEINQNSTSRSATVAQVAAFARGTATDTVVLPAGTVSAPGLTFTGDTNTGIYSPAADTIAFTEGGVEAMRIDGSGNVGIGTSSPGERLVVQGGTDVYQSWRNNTGIVGAVGAVGAASFFHVYTASNTPIAFGTNNSERMRIDTSGNVGIGTSAPGVRLAVVGSNNSFADTIYANNTATGTGAWGRIGFQAGSFYGFIGTDNNGLFQFYNPNNTAMMFATNNAERMRIDSAGNVGIGVTTGLDRLTVRNDQNASTRIALNNQDAGSSAESALRLSASGATWDVATGSTARNSNSLTFGVVGSEFMRITSGGNVGIGTSSPAWRLTAVGGATQISPGTSAQEGIRFTRSTGVCTINGINNDNNAYNALSFATGASEAMRITTGGEVYIAGTTDQGAYNLQVNGTGVWGAGAYVNGSDARIKDDIAPLASGLDVVAKLKPVQFRYKESWSKDTSLQPGFIAQELQAALADQPYVDGVVLQGPEYMSVAYQSLIPLLTKAIQELKADNDALKARVAALENK